jgi:dTDP-4-amino-4,6-dideoxygalactose transaminase
VPVHCYGHPCDVDAIETIAARHGLRVLYDAAHAFDVRLDGTSLLQHGDLAVLSFHAIKVFHTFEGGAVVSHSAAMKSRIDNLKNFGIVNEVEVVSLGMNGKMSELNAAFGLLQLGGIDKALARRVAIDSYYRRALDGIAGINCLPLAPRATCNGSYFPILVNKPYPLSRDDLHQRLRNAGIISRRYFYPLISDFPMYNMLPSASPANLPHARAAAAEVICLPIYPELEDGQLTRIVDCIAGPAARLCRA